MGKDARLASLLHTLVADVALDVDDDCFFSLDASGTFLALTIIIPSP